MKSPRVPLVLLATSVVAIHTAMAQLATTQTELKDLRSRYEYDLSMASQPVQARYIAQLQTLLKTVTQRGDLPAANVVQAEIDRVTNAFGKPIPVVSGQCRLVGTVWENADKSHIEFLPDGQFREVYRKKTFTATWRAISLTEAEITWDDGNKSRYELNPDQTVSRPDTKLLWKPVK